MTLWIIFQKKYDHLTRKAAVLLRKRKQDKRDSKWKIRNLKNDVISNREEPVKNK